MEPPAYEIKDGDVTIIYTIGKRGGLYHQVKGSNKPPTRIHHSHPPMAHKPLVKAWQDSFCQANGLVLSKRYDPNKPPELHAKELNCKFLSNDSQIQENKKVPHRKQEKQEKQEKVIEKQEKQEKVIEKQKQKNVNQRKFSRKTTLNLNQEQLERLSVQQPKATQNIAQEHKCVTLPTSLQEMQDNLTKLDFIKYFPNLQDIYQEQDFLSKYSSRLIEVYFSSNITVNEAKCYASERLIKQGTDISFFSEPYYKSFLSLDPFKGLLGFYCQADIILLDNFTVVKFDKINCYQGAEPVLSSSLSLDISNELLIKNCYEEIFGKMFLCATTHQLKQVYLQLSNSININVQKQQISALSAILHVLKQNNSEIQVHFIGQNECESLKMEFGCSVTESWEKVIKETKDIQNILFASFCDMRYLLSSCSMFDQSSTMPLQIYGLTNTQFQNADIFISY